LREYLKPNKQNWVTNTGELNFCIRNSRIITYTGYEINRLNRRIRQYHIYRHAGFDVLKQCNVPDSDLLWRTLFNELFCPSELLLKKIESFHIEENTYIAVVLRFLNALEPFEENLKPFYDNSLHSPEDKQRLMTKCIDAINKLQIRYGTTTKILVFSDSRLFLNKVKDELSDIVVLDGKIGNIRNNYSQTIMNEVALKSFVDFFMISRASKVYRICAPEMYYSAFPVYAAVAGGKEFESVNTDTNF
jgi:RNAse (barnase) inhibitor barstar